MIANFAITNDIIVVTDEIYSDLSYDDDHLALFQFQECVNEQYIFMGFRKHGQ